MACRLTFLHQRCKSFADGMGPTGWRHGSQTIRLAVRAIDGEVSKSPEDSEICVFLASPPLPQQGALARLGRVWPAPESGHFTGERGRQQEGKRKTETKKINTRLGGFRLLNQWHYCRAGPAAGLFFASLYPRSLNELREKAPWLDSAKDPPPRVCLGPSFSNSETQLPRPFRRACGCSRARPWLALPRPKPRGSETWPSFRCWWRY